MKSQHNFQNTPSVKIPRSTFNLSHPHKTAFDADYLVPICQPIDIIPGDTMRFKTSFFMRLATPLDPILDNLYFDTFAFFVPYRTIWENHEKFHGAQDDPGDSISFTIPLVDGPAAAGTTDIGTLWEYFGLPIDVIPDDVPVSALPFRAYTKIYNDWFRSATHQDSWIENTDNGPDTLSTSSAAGNAKADLFKRGKRFDYFTNALPAPQRGTAPTVSLGTTAPVQADGTQGPTFSRLGSSGADVYGLLNQLGTTPTVWQFNTTDGAAEWLNPALEADLSASTGISINDIRLAFATQQILERDARSGTRYVESLQARWGVVSPDFRLQRAELLGTGSTRVMINPVAQTSGQPTPADQDKLGNLAGVGTASGTHSWSKSFVEHGVLIVLGNLRGDITYSQGVDRYWSKTTRYDFVYPEMAHIGEQAILNSEIWVTGTGTPATDDAVFGYTGRYDEHRYLNSKLTNLMRTATAGGGAMTGSLSPWHLSERFSALPTLGATFIESNTGTPLDNAIAIPTEPHMIADFYHEIKAARPLPTYGVPGLTRL